MEDRSGESASTNAVRSFDDNGDLKLEVGKETGSKQISNSTVCSKSLSRASKVFKVMLYGSMAESRSQLQAGTEDRWTVELPEDDPVALAVLLSIIHNTFESVPESVTSLQLFHITILTDNYDMTHILRPWAPKWIQTFRRHATTGERDAPHPDYLLFAWISYVLGDATLYQCARHDMFRFSKLDFEDRIRFRGDSDLEPGAGVYIVKAVDLGLCELLLSKTLTLC